MNQEKVFKIKKIYLFLISVFLFCFFIFFSYLVAKEKFSTFDFNTTVKFQDHISRRFDYPFSIFSVIGSIEVTGIIWGLLLIYLLIRRFYLTALSFFLLPAALGIELFGKVFVLHPAPPHLFYRGTIQFNFLPTDYVQTEFSYPSGHLTRTAFIVIFLMTYFYFRTSLKKQIFIQSFLIGFLIIMAVSRIYLAEHWTSDVIGGILIGSSFGLISGLTLPNKKLKVED